MKKLLCKFIFLLIVLGITSVTFGQARIRAEIQTELGDISLILKKRRAPLTVNNFLQYIDSGLFDSTSFYRVVTTDNQPDNPVKIKVIQGGRYEDEDKGFEPVSHENTSITGIKHRKGTISMARLGPGTATSEFFICLRRERELDYGGTRNKDGQGFAAFGRVRKGLGTIKRIYELGTENQYLDKPVKIIAIRREEKY